MNNINIAIMNKINKVEGLKQEVIDYVKSMLVNTGEQGFSHDGLSIVVVRAVNEICDEIDFYIDRIKVDERGNLLVHDYYKDRWSYTTYFGYQNLIFLIQYIDWK